MKINLEKLGLSEEELKYYNSKPDFETAWNDCPRGDWMLWTACKLDVDNGLIARTAIECAGTVRHLMSDPRSINALDSTIEYLGGKISIEELRLASAAAYDAKAAAADAAYSAAFAAYAASAATLASESAASYSAAAAAYSAYASAAALARAAAYAADAAADACEKNQRQTADICRKYLTPAVLVAVKKLKKLIKIL